MDSARIILMVDLMGTQERHLPKFNNFAETSFYLDLNNFHLASITNHCVFFTTPVPLYGMVSVEVPIMGT